MTGELDGDSLLLLGATLVRIGTAGALIPIFAPGLIPPVVRNSAFVALSLIVLILQPVPPARRGMGDWLSLFSREAFIGLTIGFMISGGLWALQIAGGYIDRKVAPGAGTVPDPLTGQETGPNEGIFGRIGIYAFAASGGLWLLVTTLLQSYAIFPVAPIAPHLVLRDASIFEAEFARIMGLSLAFAGPALVLLAAGEAALALLNRFTPQLNVFSVSLALKSWLASFILLAVSGLLAKALTDETLAKAAGLPRLLRSLSSLAAP